MNIETAVKKFVEENFLYKKNIQTIANDAALLDAGLIDSMGIFQLVNFIESGFGVEVLDEEVVPENFESINAIVSFINAKKK